MQKEWIPKVLTILFCLAPLGVLSLHADDDEVTVSPRKSFKIVQHRNNNGGVDETLQFSNASRGSVLLEASIPWPAQYYVSSDEHWILRIQKSGSGDNISFLYHIDEHGKLWRKEEQIGDLGFAFLAKDPTTPRHRYHTGIEFKSWNLKKGQLHFSIHGSDGDKSGKGIRRDLIYHLGDETISQP